MFVQFVYRKLPFLQGTTDFRERADENDINVAVSEIFTNDPRLHVTNLKVRPKKKILTLA